MQESQSRSRRVHSAAFKAQVVTESQAAGASVAQVAFRHGVNANLVHRWRRAAKCGVAQEVAEAPAFLPLVIAAASPRPASSPPSLPTAAAADIRIELRRGAATVSVSWPVSAASDCGAWLTEWLR